MNLSVFENRDVMITGCLIRVAGVHLFNETAIDLFDDLINTWQQFRDHGDRPFFKGFRKYGVIGEADGFNGHVPGGIPIVMFFIDEDTHQFRNTECRMGIIDMDTNLVRETCADDLLRGEEILSEVSRRTGVPIKYTAYVEEVVKDMTPEVKAELSGEVVPLTYYMRASWM